PRLDAHCVWSGLERSEDHFRIRMLNRLSIGAKKLYGNGKAIRRSLLRVVEAEDDLQLAVPIGLIQPRIQVQRGNMDLGQGVNPHRAVYAAQAVATIIAGVRQPLRNGSDFHFEIEPV